MNQTRIVAIIPSRLESSRLPRKALTDICGLPMIVHVFKRCEFAKSLNEVFVATDSDEICQIVERHGGKVLMTSSHHKNGTERIAEAAFVVDPCFDDKGIRIPLIPFGAKKLFKLGWKPKHLFENTMV